MVFFIYFLIIYIVFCAFFAEILQKDYLLHIAQLYNYRHYEYSKWLFNKENIKSNFIKILLLVFSLFIFIFSFYFYKNNKFNNFCYSKIINSFFGKAFILAFYLIIYSTLFSLTIKKKRKMKKALVYTKRAIRLKILYYFLYFLFLVSIVFIFLNPKNLNLVLSSNRFIIYALYISLFGFLIFFIYNLTPIIMLISQFIMYPFENFINRKYFISAKIKIEKLKQEGLLVIGITGSYGKTSVKNYVKSIFTNSYNTLASELSYNTPMGLSKTINDQLKKEHQIFISEMGARYINDIDELIDLCKPDIGVLTAIGPAHIETFKSIDNILDEKWKLIEKSKIGIINIDNDYLYLKSQNTKDSDSIILMGNENLNINLSNLIKTGKTYLFTYGTKKERNPYFYIDDIELKEEKTTFKIKIFDERELFFQTKLLGKHSTQNLCAAISLGYIFGIDYKLMFDAINKIEPVEHRLQLIKPNNMLLIIDDAFNSNPDSANAALDVLRIFKDRKKIIVTPGFIELGKMQYQKNKDFAKKISEVVDFAIFVGKTNKKALIEGFTHTNDNYFYTNTLDGASSFLPKLIDRKTVVLFENDLPDNYEN